MNHHLNDCDGEHRDQGCNRHRAWMAETDRLRGIARDRERALTEAHREIERLRATLAGSSASPAG